MYISSPGGAVDAGLAIYDTMHLIQPVATTCIGMAASMGAALLGGGAKGKRSPLPNSRILIHQASAGFEGTAADIEVRAREILRMNARLQEMMAADTGQSVGREGRTPTASRDVICQRTDRYGRLGRKCMSVISAIASLGSA